MSLELIYMGNTARKLPLLDNVRIATPCSESWDGMVGDDRVRFCGGCMKNVYNVSAMSSDEAETLIADKEGDVCVRLYRRKDGTVITSDCSVGLRRKRVTKIAAAALAFGGAGLAFAAAAEPPPEAPCDVPVRADNKPRNRADGPSFWDRVLGEDDVEVELGEPEVIPPLMGSVSPGTPEAPPTPREDDRVPTLE